MQMSRSVTVLQRVCRAGRVAPSYSQCGNLASSRSSSLHKPSTSVISRRSYATTEGVGIGATHLPPRISKAESDLAKALEEEQRVEEEKRGYHRMLTNTDALAKQFEEEMRRTLPPKIYELIQQCFVHVDHTNYEKDIINGKGPMLFEVFSEYNLPCKIMRPFLRECVLSKNGKLRLAFMDAELYRNQIWSVQFSLENQYPELRVFGFPTVFALLDGKVVGKLTGYHNAKEIEEFVQKSFGNL